LAHGPIDCLYHACKAVEQAERGIRKYGDEKGVGTKLLEIAHDALKHVNDSAAAAMNRGNNQGGEQAGGQEKSSTEEQSKVPPVEKARGKCQEAGEEERTMTYVEEAELLGRAAPGQTYSSYSPHAPWINLNSPDQRRRDAP
jgi:hypothetical protein